MRDQLQIDLIGVRHGRNIRSSSLDVKRRKLPMAATPHYLRHRTGRAHIHGFRPQLELGFTRRRLQVSCDG